MSDVMASARRPEDSRPAVHYQLSSSRVRHLYAGLACETKDGMDLHLAILEATWSTSCSLCTNEGVLALPTPVVEVSPVAL
jgi:hypothetical protein